DAKRICEVRDSVTLCVARSESVNRVTLARAHGTALAPLPAETRGGGQRVSGDSAAIASRTNLALHCRRALPAHPGAGARDSHDRDGVLPRSRCAGCLGVAGHLWTAVAAYRPCAGAAACHADAHRAHQHTD